ncbi:MAG: chromate transporter [Thermoprotei archaeon]|nr:MAG: chromate transporter [Thermoprotei archaeon]
MGLPLLLELFIRFLKVGIVGFGGGWAILPIIEREIVEEAKWMTKSEYLDLVAIAGSTPGPVAVNAATYVGFKLAGPLGAFIATLAVILPPFTIVSLIAYALTAYITNRLVQAVLNGLKAAIIGLIILALITMAKGVYTTLPKIPQITAIASIIIFMIVSVSVFKIHPLIPLSISALIGLLLGVLRIW